METEATPPIVHVHPHEAHTRACAPTTHPPTYTHTCAHPNQSIPTHMQFHRSMGVMQFHRSMGVLQFHRSMGVLQFHRSMGVVTGTARSGTSIRVRTGSGTRTGTETDTSTRTNTTMRAPHSAARQKVDRLLFGHEHEDQHSERATHSAARQKVDRLLFGHEHEDQHSERATHSAAIQKIDRLLFGHERWSSQPEKTMQSPAFVLTCTKLTSFTTLSAILASVVSSTSLPRNWSSNLVARHT
jgi:hypothetical protein